MRFGFSLYILGLFLLNLIGSAEEIKDGFGSSWSLLNRPTKVASAFLSADEILLDLTQGTGIQLIATSTVAEDELFSNIAREIKNIPFRIGNNPEFLAKIKPDLVFLASWNRPEFINTLKKLGINTFVLSEFNSIKDIENNIQAMSKVLHLSDKGSEMITRMNQGMPQQDNKNLRVIKFDSSGFIMGKNTIFDSLLERLGLTNVVKEKGWPKLSPEALARLKPDMIIVAGLDDERPKALSNLQKTPGWQNLKVLSEERIIMIPEKLLSAASPHLLKTYEMLSKKVIEFKARNELLSPEKKLLIQPHKKEPNQKSK